MKLPYDQQANLIHRIQGCDDRLDIEAEFKIDVHPATLGKQDHRSNQKTHTEQVQRKRDSLDCLQIFFLDEKGKQICQGNDSAKYETGQDKDGSVVKIGYRILHKDKKRKAVYE